jgi:hypothetical protein
MRIESLQIEGVRHTGTASVSELAEVDTLPAAPAGTSLGDGLSLIAAALDHTRTAGILGALGLGTALEVTEDGPWADEVSGLDPHGVASFVDDLPVRRVIVSATLGLDPLLYRRLRDQAQRNPSVLAALASDSRLDLRIGWLFNTAGTHASPAPLSVRVGQVSFPLDSERPNWLPGLLAAVAQRLDRLDPTRTMDDLAADLLAAALSPDPTVRRRYRLAGELLSSPPFGLPELQLVQRGARIEPCFGPELVPVRLMGDNAEHALRWVHAAVVRAPDVLLADARTSPARGWLGSRIDGPDATLEQVLLTGRAHD